MLSSATLTSGSGLVTSSSNYGQSNYINAYTVSNVNGAYIKFDNRLNALVGGTGANGGSGLSGVTVTISAPDIPGGIQATASATVTNGTITAYSIINPGSGYSYAPSISISRTGFTTLPTTPTMQFALDGNNPVVWSEGNVAGAPSVNVTSGYISTPTVSITTMHRCLPCRQPRHSARPERRYLGCLALPGRLYRDCQRTHHRLRNLTKTGNGTLVLNASSNYTGATAINGGTTIVSGSISGTPNVSVASGATLEVDGYLNVSATTTLNGTLRGNERRTPSSPMPAAPSLRA